MPDPTPHKPTRPTAAAPPDDTGGRAHDTGGPAANPSTVDLRPGSRPIPEYELVALLGEGGFGQVWKALGPGGIEVALKFVRLDGRAGEAEMRALQAVKNIRHPHLLPLFGTWQVGRWLVLAMELADKTLYQRLTEAERDGQPGISRAELLEYMAEAAKGLDYLHGQGIQHRDVKGQNVLLVGGAAKVGDFGLAKVLERSLASSSGAMTPAYAAPEQIQGQVSQHSDQYSLAVTFCQLRGGRLPFEGGPHQVMFGHLQGQPDLSMIPEAERPAVAQALAKDPVQRWPTCRAFVEALARPGAGEPAPAPPPARRPAPVPAVRPTPRQRGPATLPPASGAGPRPAPVAAGPGAWQGQAPAGGKPSRGRRAWPYALAVVLAVGATAALLVAYSVGPPRTAGRKAEATGKPTSPPAQAPGTPESPASPHSAPGKSVTGATQAADRPKATRQEPEAERAPVVPPVPPPPVASLRLLPVAPVTLAAGGKATLAIRVERTNYLGEVFLEFGALPGGVTVSPSRIEAGRETAELTLTADASTPAGERLIYATARSGNLHDTVYIRLTLSSPAPPPEPAASLRVLPISPVTLRAGREAKVTVEVRRENCPGRIDLALHGLPADVKASPGTIEPESTTGHLTLTADGDAEAVWAQVTVIAQAGSVRDERQFRLSLLLR